MKFYPELAAALLRARRVKLTPGLSNDEFAACEARYDVEFSVDHRRFLAQCVPVGDGWYDWRSGDASRIEEMLRRPVEGLLFHVKTEDIWDTAWGQRPCEAAMAIDVAASHLAHVPRLIPIYSHRYMPPAPAPAGAPVLSVYSSDVIYYGADLASYIRKEFGSDKAPVRNDAIRYRTPFWADLIDAN